jgi:hypothetical protein
VWPFSAKKLTVTSISAIYANSTLSYANKIDSWLGDPSLRSSLDLSEYSSFFTHSFRRGHWPTSSTTCNTRYEKRKERFNFISFLQRTSPVSRYFMFEFSGTWQNPFLKKL